jgi:hypothetical protein
VEKKVLELAALLKDKRLFYVNIEKPNNKGSTEETIIEDKKGISFKVEENTIIFSGNGKTAPFEILENTQIITKRTAECEVLTTFAENGGLQIKNEELKK